MAAHLQAEDIENIAPSGDPSAAPSSERIKQLALDKRREYITGSEEKPMKRASFRVALIAAAICLVSISAFAAFGGLEYFKGIFGESVHTIEGEIITPEITVSADGRDMALEALVTDGFVTNMVVSLTGSKPADEQLFAVTTDVALRSTSWSVLEDYSTKDKTFYAVEVASEQRFDTADIVLSLNPDVAAIEMPIHIENNLGNAVATFPAGAMSGDISLKEMQISPMGFLLIGHEDDAQGGLPPTSIQLVFADGKTEEIEVEFMASDELMGGGGGAVLVDEGAEAPFVVGFQGARNPDGELVINGRFSRVINPDNIVKLVIDGAEYDI